MTKVFSVSMNKGGVGKSTLVTNLAGALSSKHNKKVLLIDMDGQGNTAMAFGLNPLEFEETIYDVCVGEKKMSEVIVAVTDNLHLIPANDEMNFLDFDILTNIEKYPTPFDLLRVPLEEIKKDYDYIFFDSPPSMGLVAGNVLSAVDNVIIPFVPEMFAQQGLVRVIESINEFKAKRNPNLNLFGVVGMMVQSGTVLHSQMLQKARTYCKENEIKIFDTVIPKSIRFANATAFDGTLAVWSDSDNKIVGSYYELLDEILETELETEMVKS